MSRRARHTLTCTADEQRTGQRLHSTQEPRNPDGTCRLQQQETFFMMQLVLKECLLEFHFGVQPAGSEAVPKNGVCILRNKVQATTFPRHLVSNFPRKNKHFATNSLLSRVGLKGDCLFLISKHQRPVLQTGCLENDVVPYTNSVPCQLSGAFLRNLQILLPKMRALAVRVEN